VRKERAGEIPMERPARFGFVVNLKTARAMGANILPFAARARGGAHRTMAKLMGAARGSRRSWHCRSQRGESPVSIFHHHRPKPDLGPSWK